MMLVRFVAFFSHRSRVSNEELCTRTGQQGIHFIEVSLPNFSGFRSVSLIDLWSQLKPFNSVRNPFTSFNNVPANPRTRHKQSFKMSMEIHKQLLSPLLMADHSRRWSRRPREDFSAFTSGVPDSQSDLPVKLLIFKLPIVTLSVDGLRFSTVSSPG